MKAMRIQVIGSLFVLTSLLVGCGSGTNKSDSGQNQPKTEDSSLSPSTTAFLDPEMAAVESELSSLDADLAVIDEAIAELDSIAP